MEDRTSNIILNQPTEENNEVSRPSIETSKLWIHVSFVTVEPTRFATALLPNHSLILESQRELFRTTFHDSDVTLYSLKRINMVINYLRRQ
jgi:hypothetical protein